MERDVQSHETMLRRYTARVRQEVGTAHMQFVQAQLAAIGSIVDASPTPRWPELPSIRVIPHSRNDVFIGRQDILAQDGSQVDAFLAKKSAVSRLRSVNHDHDHDHYHNNAKAVYAAEIRALRFRGVCKTQIALEYTYRHLDDYKVVLWILADSTEMISQGFGETAEILGLTAAHSDSQTRSFVLQRLSTTNEPYLLCFDNADDPSLVKNCFPRDNLGTIMVTTRDAVGAVEAVKTAVAVPEFSIDQGRDLLGSMLPNVDLQDTNSRTALRDISTVFHGYPLALTLCARPPSHPLNRFDRSSETQLLAKKICGDVPPQESDAITIVQLNLGFLLYRRGDLHNAEQMLRATLGANPRTAPAMYALGNTLLAAGKAEETIALHLKGLEIYIEMFGDQHALVGRCAYKVGEILLLHKQDPQTARTYIDKAIKIYLNQESPYHTTKAYARAARMLAKAFEMEGRVDVATQ